MVAASTGSGDVSTRAVIGRARLPPTDAFLTGVDFRAAMRTLYWRDGERQPPCPSRWARSEHAGAARLRGDHPPAPVARADRVPCGDGRLLPRVPRHVDLVLAHGFLAHRRLLR